MFVDVSDGFFAWEQAIHQPTSSFDIDKSQTLKKIAIKTFSYKRNWTLCHNPVLSASPVGFFQWVNFLLAQLILAFDVYFHIFNLHINIIKWYLIVCFFYRLTPFQFTFNTSDRKMLDYRRKYALVSCAGRTRHAVGRHVIVQIDRWIFSLVFDQYLILFYIFFTSG